MIDTSLKYQTPLPVCMHMIDMLPAWCNSILEPTPGQGNISGLLQQRKYKVTAPIDFFQFDCKSMKRFDAVIMNPPFTDKSLITTFAPSEVNLKGMRAGYYILDRCMERTDNVIALMPWFTILDSDVRLKLLKKYGLISVTALPRKTFNYDRIQTCILQLQKGYRGETILKSFDINLLKK